jgi:hypothetical protein
MANTAILIPGATVEVRCGAGLFRVISFMLVSLYYFGYACADGFLGCGRHSPTEVIYPGFPALVGEPVHPGLGFFRSDSNGKVHGSMQRHKKCQ